MVMHARKTPRISDGYFEKHQAHPYQSSSKYSKTSSSSSTTQQQQQLGGSSATSSSSDHHRSYSDSHHHRLSRDSPNNGTYHSSHHHHHRGSGGGGGGGSSAEGISPLLDDSGGGNRKGFGGGKIHSKEREIRDYKRDKYSDCSRSPKDSALGGGGKQRTARGPSSTSSSSTSTSALNVNNDMSLVNAGCSGGGLLAERDRTNHDRSSLLAVDQQMLADGGAKSKSGGSRGDRGGKQQQGSGVHNNCLDKHSIGESRHSTSNASTSQSQSQSTGNSQLQSTTASASATTNTNAQSQSSGGSSSTSSSRVGDWSEHLSSSGKRYYYNCKTEVSQWEKPREWLLMDRESGNNSQRSSVGESGRSDRGDREGGGSSRTADRDRSDGGRQYRDSRDSRDGGRDRGDGGGYNRGGSTRHIHDKHSNSRQPSSTNASASSTSAPGDRQTSSSSTANSSNSTSSNNNAALAIVGASRSTGDKSHQHHHTSTSSSAAARQHCSGASGGTGDSASRDIALDIGQKDTSGRLSRIGKGGGNYHHQQIQQQEVVQDMDISPGDSTPTSETSPSNPNQPTNAVNSAVPTTAVLLANALPRLTSHPLTPSTATSADHASTAMTTTPALTAAMATDLGATTSDVAMLEAGGAGGVSLQDGGATPTHSELPDVARGETAMSGQQQQVLGINGGVVIMPGSSLQAVIPIISNCSHQSTSATASMITSLPTSCAASIVRSAASTSVVVSGNSGNHLVTASLAQHVRDDLLAHVRGWPADIVERQAVKCAEEAALVGGVQCARVSAELKTARAIVRLTEIQATLQEQRILFLRQQIKMLEELKSQNSFMSDDT